MKLRIREKKFSVIFCERAALVLVASFHSLFIYCFTSKQFSWSYFRLEEFQRLHQIHSKPTQWEGGRLMDNRKKANQQQQQPFKWRRSSKKRNELKFHNNKKLIMHKFFKFIHEKKTSWAHNIQVKFLSQLFWANIDNFFNFTFFFTDSLAGLRWMSAEYLLWIDLNKLFDILWKCHKWFWLPHSTRLSLCDVRALEIQVALDFLRIALPESKFGLCQIQIILWRRKILKLNSFIFTADWTAPREFYLVKRHVVAEKGQWILFSV